MLQNRDIDGKTYLRINFIPSTSSSLCRRSRIVVTIALGRTSSSPSVKLTTLGVRQSCSNRADDSLYQSVSRLTNDGNAILREIDVAHPAAKNMIELSRTQDEEVGDGTTSVIILGMEKMISL